MKYMQILVTAFAMMVALAFGANEASAEVVPLSSIMAIGMVMDGERITGYGTDGYITENVDVGVDAASTATIYCGWRRARVTYRSFIWTVQWWYQQKQSRCYNSVTKKLGQVYGWERDWAVPGAPWQFVKNYPRETWGAGYTWHFGTKIRGYFKLCYPVAGCIEHRYPYIKQDFYGDGAYTHKKVLG